MLARIAASLRNKKLIASLSVSMLMHVAVLIVCGLIAMGLQQITESLETDSILSRNPEIPVIQQMRLSDDDRVSDSLNTQTGPKGSRNMRPPLEIRPSPPPMSFGNGIFEPILPQPTPRLPEGADDGLPGVLEGINGEPTAPVMGYRDALNRITAELLRLLLQNDKLLVVWLFDESESMKDDQREIAKNLDIVYKELGIKLKDDKRFKRRETTRSKNRVFRSEILLTTVYGFGQTINRLLPPTADLKKVVHTIGNKISVDRSGKEKTCSAIARVVQSNRDLANRHRRKLVVIVVSDESGDDGNAVEQVIKVAAPRNGQKTPVYFLGREAIFGYPYAYHRWRDPKFGLWHNLRIKRGPETAFPECLQWNGLRSRQDAFSAHFGPYEQVRIARETNGIFFMLPGREGNLVGAGARMKRMYQDVAKLREYHPTWTSRSKYAVKRKESKFREAIWRVVVALNPTKHEQFLIPKHNPMLNIRQHHYPITLSEFKLVAAREAKKAYFAWHQLGQAIQLLRNVEKLRSREPSMRWRANFDLMKALCLAYRVRLFQFMLTMDAHVNAQPQRKPRRRRPEPYNEWWFRRDRTMIVPDPPQFERVMQLFRLTTKREKFLAILKKQKEDAASQLADVVKTHPETPWAQFADWELRMGFGMRLEAVYWNPKYRHSEIKIPKF